MAAIVKTVLPSFSIFRKPKKPVMTDNENPLNSGDLVLGLPTTHNQAESSIIQSTSFLKTPSPCYWKTGNLANDPNSHATGLTATFREQLLCREIVDAADQHRLGDPTTQCADYPTTETGGFSCDEQFYPSIAHVPTENTQPDLESPGVLAAMHGAENAWATLSSGQESSDYNIKHSSQDAFSLSPNDHECFQTPRTSGHNEILWPEEEATSSQAYQMSYPLPAPDYLMETFNGQMDPSNPMYCPVGVNLNTENIGKCSIFSSVPYRHERFPSSDMYDNARTGDFNGFDLFSAVNALGYNHVETFGIVGDQQGTADAPYTFPQSSGHFGLASQPSNQIAEVSEENNNLETAGPSYCDDSHQLRDHYISKGCDKESEENETVEDPDRADECIMDDDQIGRDRKDNSKVESYIALISKAILDSPQKKLPISDIYAHIRKHNPGISTSQKSWQNTVRHNLSLNECFVKQVRKGKGRGHYWMVHPACVDDFLKGNYRRRHARRRAKKCPLIARETTFIGGRHCEENTGLLPQFDTVSEMQSPCADNKLWDTNNQFSEEIQPSTTLPNPLTEQSYFMMNQLDNPSQAVDNIHGVPLASDSVHLESWFAGEETATSTDWFEFPGNW